MRNKFYVIWECQCGYVNRWKWAKEDRQFIARGEVMECGKCIEYSKITDILATLPRVDLLSAVPVSPTGGFKVLTDKL